MDKKIAISRFHGPQYSLLYWKAQVKEILNTNQVWPVVQVDDAARLSSSHQVQASHEGYDACSDPEYARDVACSVIQQGLGEVPFACLIQYQEDPQQMRSFLTSGTGRHLRSVKRPCIQHWPGWNTPVSRCMSMSRTGSRVMRSLRGRTSQWTRGY